MALTSRLVTFKSWWLSPKVVQIRLYRQTPRQKTFASRISSRPQCIIGTQIEVITPGLLDKQC
jgi:hypothetical protein